MPQKLINIGQSPNDNTGDTIRDAFNSTNTNFTEVFTDVADTQTEVTSLRTDLTTTEGEVTNLRTDLTTAEGEVTNLRTDLTTAESEVTNLKTDLTGAQGGVTNLRTDLTAAEASILSLEDSVSTIENRPENATYASDFGAVGDGVTDDTDALQAALDHAGNLLETNQELGIAGRTQVRLFGGTFKISRTLTIRNATTLIGELRNPPYPNRASEFRNKDNYVMGSEILCSADFVGKEAIYMESDGTGIEDLILDGHFIPSGTNYSQVRAILTNGEKVVARTMKLTINDADDPRINTFGFECIEIPAFRVGANLEFQLNALGGDGNYTFTLAPDSGPLPPGLTLDPNGSGLISGIPTEKGLRFPKFTVTDGTGQEFTKSFTVGVIYDEIKSRDMNPATATVDSSFQLESRWGANDLEWELVGDETPSWASLSTDGLFSVTGTLGPDAGFYDFKIRLVHVFPSVDEEGDPITIRDTLETRHYHFEIRYDNGAIRVYGDHIKPKIDTPFSYTYLANGGYGDYVWSINADRSNGSETAFTNNDKGNLYPITATSPFPGLTLDGSTGTISGTIPASIGTMDDGEGNTVPAPTKKGTNAFYLRCTSNVDPKIFFEGRYLLDAKAFGEDAKQISRSFPTGQKGQPYSFQFKFEEDPNNPIVDYILDNAPTGLSINSDGLITGTPVGSNYVDGIRFTWSSAAKNLSIRGFLSGSGIYSVGRSNIHRIHRTMIAVCDRGIGYDNQTYDSHYSDLYIYNCRVGMDFGPGAAGTTVTDTRIEFIHEDGLKLKTASENDFSNIYFDTCGWSSIRSLDSANNVFTACRSYRSGRLVRGVGVMTNPLANKSYSNHVYLENSHRFTFSGNSFDLGSDDAGDKIYLTDRVSDNLRPYVGFRIKNCKELVIVGNNITGCVENAFEADLGTFGDNTFKGYRISGNTQSDIYMQAVDIKTVKETVYIPNQSFKAWQRDNEFNIPPASGYVKFPVADYWSLNRSGIDVINQPINVSRQTDGLKEFDKYYIKIQKALNTTTAPNSNEQTLMLENKYSKDLKYTSGKGCVFSFWGRSSAETTVQPRLIQDPDFANNDIIFTHLGGKTKLTTKWVRYSFYFLLDPFNNTDLGQYAKLNIQFLMNKFDDVIDVDLAGVQIDFNLQTPFAQKLRADTLEEAIQYAKLKYQKSKNYDQYLPSWAKGVRYDVNGNNYQPGYSTIPSFATSGSSLQSTIIFDPPLPIELENPDNTGPGGGHLKNVKILHPAHLNDRIHANKYAIGGTGDPAAKIIAASPTRVIVSATGSTITPDENYSYHWLYTTYDEDVEAITTGDPAKNTSGGGYAIVPTSTLP